MFFSPDQIRQLNQDRLASVVRSAKAAHNTRIKPNNRVR